MAGVRLNMRFRLYVKFPGQKRFSPVDWSRGVQVVNLIHASLFTSDEVETLKRVDLVHPDNASMEWKFKRVAWAS